MRRQWHLDGDFVARANGPPFVTTPITPAFGKSFPSGDQPRTANMTPVWKRSICTHGFLRPVSVTIERSPICNSVPKGSDRRSSPRVVIFSPRWPGRTLKPFSCSWSSNSSWMRCTCRKLGCEGSRNTRAVFNRYATVSVAFNTQAIQQYNLRSGLLGERV